MCLWHVSSAPISDSAHLRFFKVAVARNMMCKKKTMEIIISQYITIYYMDNASSCNKFTPKVEKSRGRSNISMSKAPSCLRTSFVQHAMDASINSITNHLVALHLVALLGLL